MRFWLSTLADDFVKGSGSGRNLPASVAPLDDLASYVSGTGVEVTSAQYNEYASKGPFIEDGGGRRWRIVNGLPVEQVDDRFILQIDIPDPEVLANTEPLVGTLRVLRPDRTVLTSFNGTRPLFLRHDGNPRKFRVSFVNGERSFSKTFAQPGRYEVVSDGTYAIDGIRSFDVVEEL